MHPSGRKQSRGASGHSYSSRKISASLVTPNMGPDFGIYLQTVQTNEETALGVDDGVLFPAGFGSGCDLRATTRRCEGQGGESAYSAADNPFVGRAGYRPEILTLGHRNALGLAVNPLTGAIWECEDGSNGGDEVNILQAGKNYGWPGVSYGRFYLGPGVSADPWKEGMEPPVVFWVPAIAISGMRFYAGDAFPNWKYNLFVGGMRQGEVPRSGHLERIDFNDQWEELHRESMLRELQNRIRDVRQGPDGFLYLLTAENDGALMRMEPLTEKQ